MGLFFSKKAKNNDTVEQYPLQNVNHHSHHPSTVSYDFNTSKGQIRALRAFQETKDKNEYKKEQARNRRKVHWR
jgi:hypothetical protein